jgi:hypothetical protein
MNKSLAVSLLSVSIALALQPALAANPKAPTFDPKRLSDEVKVLSSDEFEGRGPATAQMQAAGLQPGGDIKDGKRTWTQAVPLLRAEITGTPVLSMSEGGKAQALTQGEQIAVRAALNGDQHVTIKDAPLVFVGYGVKAPERK